jgi:hypothetical protein
MLSSQTLEVKAVATHTAQKFPTHPHTAAPVCENTKEKQNNGLRDNGSN